MPPTHPRTGRLIRKGLFGIAAACLILYLAAFATLAVRQRAFMYFQSGGVTAPAAVGLPNVQEMHLKTSDGETLRAWYIAPTVGKPLLLYFHGNGDNLASLHGIFQALTAGGGGLLAVEYRGYPGSTGSPSEAGLLRDGDAAYAKAIALGVPARHIVIVGESLGTGVAVAEAARHEIGALVLDSPYSSAVDIAAERFWMFPVRWVMIDQFRSDRRIAKVHAPLLILHGDQDRIIPIRFGRKLFALANAPKTFITVPGAGHVVLPAVTPQALKWIDKAVARNG